MNKEKILLRQAGEYAFEYMDNLNEKRVFPDKEQLKGLSNFDEPLPEDGTEADKVIDMLHQYGSPATTAQTGGRYYGFVNGGILPVAHAAQWIVDTWNPNSALYAMSPVASKLEQICEEWLTDLFGLPEGTALGLVTGSSNALICALAAARNELLKRQGYDIKSKGLRNAPPIRVIMGDGAHSCVGSALSVLGIGSDEIETVPVDGMGRIITSEIPQLDNTCLLILQAANVNGGSFDPFDEIIEMANRAGAWVHIDGAFGLWAACSEKHKYLTKGFEKADSWNCDAHKTLNAGYDCGLVMCRHREALTDALAANGAYIAYSENRDNMLYTTEMSRRARGVILWAVLKALGKKGVADLIDRLCDLASYFADELKNAGIQLVNPPCFNQIMVKGSSDEDTLRILQKVQESGECWCGGSVWEGHPVIRISVCSHATTKEDIDRSVDVFRRTTRSDKNNHE